MAIDGLYDVVEVALSKGKGSINIEVEGFDVPSGPNNVVYHIAKTFIDNYGLTDIDLYIRLVKGVPPSCGLGSSGASCAATAYALAQLLHKDIDEYELLRLAAIGEAMVAGEPHYDNVAASLFGGVVLIDLLKGRVYKIRSNTSAYVSVIIPKDIIRTERKTKFARSILPRSIDLDTYIKQSSVIAKLVYALVLDNTELLGEAISVDFIVEPYRSKLIPYYYELKELALGLGALGFNISGAGPAMFSIFRTYEKAIDVSEKLISYLRNKGLNAEFIVTKVNEKGVEVIR